MNFEQAVESVKVLSSAPSDADKLLLYGLYKQATVGDVNVSRPYFYKLVECAKWDAWSKHKGAIADDVKAKYVELVTLLINRDVDITENVI